MCPSPVHPFGDAIETFIRREEAERFVEEVRGEDPELASYLRIEERELEAGVGRTDSEGRARATPLAPKRHPVVLNAWLRPKCATFCPRWTPTSLDRR